MIKTELHKKFQGIYEQLNDEQQKAVNAIYGPVLVVAGPGTGKTQILSARIGKILLETDYLPENILCLTYTDAGRIAIRKRLQEMIGADAYRVPIHTFHSFCNQIIQENVALFNKQSLDAISDLEKIEYLKQIIDGFEKNNPLKRYRSDVYFEMDRLLSLFSIMKKEGWTPTFLKSNIQSYLDSLPERETFIYKVNGKNYKKGDPKTALLEAEKQKMSMLLAAISAFESYQNLMLNNNRYDFDDMINWVIEAFQKHPDLLLDTQEKYQFFLVDEYQDTSGTQNKILQLLSEGVEKPNIFVVGDDDQSIYRFQGANIENIESYRNQYASELEKIVLKQNYRSTQAILNASKALIENNQERLSNKDASIVKDLKAANPIRLKAKMEPRLVQYENSFQEMVGITMSIQQLIQEGTPPQQIAVLYKENKRGMELMKFFKQKNIPYYSKLKENLFDIAMSKKIITLLRYLAAEIKIPYSGDELLFEILHFEHFHIPPFEIAKACVRVNDLKYEKKTSLRQYFIDWINTKNRTLFDESPYEGLVKITTHIEKWLKDTLNGTVIQLVENIMIEGGFLQIALQDPHDKRWHLEVLRSLMDFVKDEMHRHPNYQLSDLLHCIELMEVQKLSIPLYRVFGNESGVNLLTVHGSKGLEFNHVFLMNTVSESWENKKAPSNSYRLPDNLFQHTQTDDASQKEEELRRLFFVAITRAEEHLQISWSKTDDKLKLTEPSKFIAEIRDKITLQTEHKTIPEDIVNEYLEIYLLKQSKPTVAEGEHEFIASLLERFEMNSTALNNYLNCPLRFYYQSLIKVPSGKNENTTFGSAVHFALEKLFEKMKENEEVFPDLAVFIQDFHWYMHKNRESFTQEAFNRRSEYGNTILTDVYNKYVSTWNKVVRVEAFFKDVVVDGIPLKGMVDKMEFEGNQVTLVDYKTGNSDKVGDKLSPPTAKNPLGGDYWRQGVFYKLMIEHYKPKDYKVVKTSFHFLEPNKKKEYLIHDIFATEEDLTTVKNQIKDTFIRIQNHDFYTGCGKDECHWCNFVKDNKQYSSLQKAIHEEDDETAINT